MVTTNIRLPLLVMSVIALVLVAGIVPIGDSTLSPPSALITSLEPPPTEATEKRTMSALASGTIRQIPGIAREGAPAAARHVSQTTSARHRVAWFLFYKHSHWLRGVLLLLAVLATSRFRQLGKQARSAAASGGK